MENWTQAEKGTCQSPSRYDHIDGARWISGIPDDPEIGVCDYPQGCGCIPRGECQFFPQELTLLSTVVAPAFAPGRLTLVPTSITSGVLDQVTRNLCGHPVTDAVLRAVRPTLPQPERAFWDGATMGLAVRPKGGVRGATQMGDTQVTIQDLEAVLVRWEVI